MTHKESGTEEAGQAPTSARSLMPLKGLPYLRDILGISVLRNVLGRS